MHIFIKSSFLRSMFKGVENESKNDGLRRRKGRTNQGKLDASTHQKIIENLLVLEVKICEHGEKNASNNNVFFA